MKKETLNTPDIVNHVAEETRYTKAVVREVLDSFAALVKSSLMKDVCVSYTGLGTWKLKDRAERMVRQDFVSDKKKKIPAYKAPSFVFAKSTRDKIREKTTVK